MFNDTSKRAQLVSFFIVKMKLAMTHESQIMNAGFFYKQHFHKQRQDDIGKKLSKS